MPLNDFTPPPRDLQDLILDGYSIVEIECVPCRTVLHVQWKAMGRINLRWTLMDVTGRMRCQRCFTKPKPEHVRAGRRMKGRVTPDYEFYP